MSYAFLKYMHMVVKNMVFYCHSWKCSIFFSWFLIYSCSSELFEWKIKKKRQEKHKPNEICLLDNHTYKSNLIYFWIVGQKPTATGKYPRQAEHRSVSQLLWLPHNYSRHHFNATEMVLQNSTVSRLQKHV